jgi:hypothetical protein
MSVTIVEIPANSRNKAITVRPFFDGKRFNMGLENYNLSMHDGVYHEEQLACLEANGTARYLTGLNEFAPEIKKLPEEFKEAKIKDIRQTIAQLEKELAANVIDEQDPDFWNKVELLRPDNHDFWSKISLRCGNEPLYLDPTNNPFDLIKIYAIEAGGFSMVARSYEDARSKPTAPKFYLDRYEETVSTKTEVKKLRNKAISELDKLYTKNVNKLFYVMKVLDINSIQYKKSTPTDVIYDNADKFINGEGVENNARRAAQMFLDACNQDIETLKIRALIKDATFLKTIVLKGDGFIYHNSSNALLGRTQADVLEYLKNPLNDQILTDILKKVEPNWNN